MAITGSSVWKSKAFDEPRKEHAREVEARSKQFVKTDDGWILFGPTDVRGYGPKFHFALQQLKCDKQLRVRVGCRYYTLPQAYRHWSRATKRGNSTSRRNEARQALAIIQLMLLQAQAYNLIPLYGRKSKITFDSSILKKRK